MSRSIIQTVNQSVQPVSPNTTIALGSVLRRYGCNCRLNGNSVIELSGQGYYGVTATVTLAPTAAGNVTVALYQDGVPISCQQSKHDKYKMKIENTTIKL